MWLPNIYLLRTYCNSKTRIHSMRSFIRGCTFRFASIVQLGWKAVRRFWWHANCPHVRLVILRQYLHFNNLENQLAAAPPPRVCIAWWWCVGLHVKLYNFGERTTVHMLWNVRTHVHSIRYVHVHVSPRMWCNNKMHNG